MEDAFSFEPSAFEVTVTPAAVTERPDCTLVEAFVENGTGDEGGEVLLQIARQARESFGLGACVAEFERWINSTLHRNFRLGAVLATASHGAFMVVSRPDSGLVVVEPATPFRRDLAA